MEEKQEKHASKFLSLILRHRPEVVGLELDEQGWVDVDALLPAIQVQKDWYTREVLDLVVANNSKQRFEFSEDKARIRARQGHSKPVDLGYEPKEPPATLYHGTAQKHLNNIIRGGLRKMKRHHVHLSAAPGLAKGVGGRHGKPVVLAVKAGRMATEGHKFYRTENGVWLTDHVPPDFLKILG